MANEFLAAVGFFFSLGQSTIGWCLLVLGCLWGAIGIGRVLCLVSPRSFLFDPHPFVHGVFNFLFCNNLISSCFVVVCGGFVIVVWLVF